MNEDRPPTLGEETATAVADTEENGQPSGNGASGPETADGEFPASANAGSRAPASVLPDHGARVSESAAGEVPGLCERTSPPPHTPAVSPEEASALANVAVSVTEPKPGGGTILVAVAEPPEALRVDAGLGEQAAADGFADSGRGVVPFGDASGNGDGVVSPDEGERAVFGTHDASTAEMPAYSDLVDIAAVRLGDLGPASFFVADKVSCQVGDKVVVELDEGLAFGEVATLTRMNPDHLLTGGSKENGDARGGSGAKIRSVMRKATEKDIASAAENADLVADAVSYCRNCIRERGLDMKLVDVLVLHNRSKMVFYFTAPSRIDFRELVKDLVRSYRTRIELRQIGVRHETQMVGAVGNCGMVCCCRRYLRTFAPVAIKMAKEQNVFLNPVKISGICGRLLCCLAYEQEHYDEFYRRCPKLGKKYQTDAGPMRVLRASMFRESVSVLNENNEEMEYPLEDWNALNPHRPNAPQGSQPQSRTPRQGGQKGRNDKPRQGEGRPDSAKRDENAVPHDSARVSSSVEEMDAARAEPVFTAARQLPCTPEDDAPATAQSAVVPDDDLEDDEDGGSIFGLSPGRAPCAVREDDAPSGPAREAPDEGGEKNMARKPRPRYNRRKSRPPRQQ